MSNKMGREKRGPLALELWAKQLIDGYPGVCVRNMTTSWRNGLAFCALIHRFRPDLIDYDKLDPSDIIGNCALAFDTAESKLGIPALLDPEDMLNLEVPDRLSVLTYVAQFYSVFKNAEAKSARVLPRTGVDEEDNLKNLSGDKSKSSSPEKMAGKRKMEVDEDEIMDKVKKSMPKRSIMLSTSNVCSECKNPVFISERILFMKKLFHRTCFRCSHCTNPLNPHVADVSPDGLLFCAETNCHLELLKRFPVSSPTANNLEVPKPRGTPDSASADSTELRNISGVDSSEKENVPSEEHHLHDGPRDKAKQADDVFPGDSQSQGDFRSKPEVVVPLTPKTNRLMNFAGAMLHADQPSNDDSEIKGNANESTEEITDTTSQLSLPEKEDSKQIAQDEENASEDVLVIDAKRTPEVVSLKDNAVLTVADQLRIAAATVVQRERKMSDSNPENIVDESGECQSIEKPEIATTTDSNTSEDSLTVPDSQTEVEIETPSVISPEESESRLENSTATVANPFEEEEKEPLTEDKEEINFPLPKPRAGSFRTTPVPSPRVQRKSDPATSSVSPQQASPVPSPIPRTRVRQPTEPDSTTESAEELYKNNDYYPADLNPFGSEEDVGTTSNVEKKPQKQEPKNPFEDDDDDETPSPNPRSSTPISKLSLLEINNNKGRSQNAANFQAPPPRPPPPQLSPRKTPIIVKPYNPFEDDEDIGEYEDDRPSGVFTRGAEETSSISSKTSDLSSITSMPTPIASLSLNTSDAEGSHGSLKKSRKSRRAPLPPSMTPTSHDSLTTPPTSTPVLLSPPSSQEPTDSTSTPVRKKIPASPKLLRGLKNPTHLTQTYRKKRRAPFPKRRVDPLPEESIKVEFADLDVRQKELERQGITLESSIRQLMDEDERQVDGSAQDEPAEEPHNHNEQLDEMIIQLWSIVNEKNDILRRQTELEYLRRGHRLEEMQADLEFKYRNLMDTPPEQREPNHADMEQILLQQLLKVVDERNEVVEWLDYHRQLDREEDLMVSQSLSQFSNPKGNEQIPETSAVPTSKSKEKDKPAKKADNSGSKSKTKEEPVVKEKKGKLKLGLFSSKKKKSKAKTEEEKLN